MFLRTAFAPALLLAALPLFAAQEFHVSVSGSDGADGSAAKPFATIERARDAVRQLRRSQGASRQPVTVYLHGGAYRLSHTLEFTPEDSATTYRALGNETPVVSGGRVISGWKAVTVTGKKLWAAEIPEVKAGNWYFHQF